MEEAAIADDLPDYVLDANLFQFFNALSFQITLGAPVILYAKSLGASATILGIINALTPLLTISQLPATRYIPRFGYRRCIMAGWGSRSLAVYGLAVVPLLVGKSLHFKLILALCLLFAFNLLRGIAAGIWWPWISEIIPPPLRPRFLARDQIFMQLGCLLSMLFAAGFLHGQAKPWQFSLVFFFSATAQLASIIYLAKMPDVTAPHRVEQISQKIPWMQILLSPAFARMIIFNIFFQLTMAGVGVFNIAWLRGTANYSDSHIIIFSSIGFLGALLTIPSIGRWLAVAGSITVIRACLLSFGLILMGWFAASAVVMPPTPSVIATMFLISGIATASFTIANWHYTIETIPTVGRNHFFAIYIVITSLATGISPIGWGALIDYFARTNELIGHFDVNRYSIYFACATMMCVLTMCSSMLLREPARR